MSNKKINGYQVFFYIRDQNGNKPSKINNYFRVFENNFHGGNYFRLPPSPAIKPGYWTLIRKKATDNERMVIHDLTVDFSAPYKENIPGAISWTIARVDNKSVYENNAHGKLRTLMPEPTGALKRNELQLFNMEQHEWFATSKTFTNIDYDVSASDNLLLLMNINFSNNTTPDEFYTFDIYMMKNYIETTLDYVQFDITYTYSDSRF